MEDNPHDPEEGQSLYMEQVNDPVTKIQTSMQWRHSLSVVTKEPVSSHGAKTKGKLILLFFTILPIQQLSWLLYPRSCPGALVAMVRKPIHFRIYPNFTLELTSVTLQDSCHCALHLLFRTDL
jgi:hypothetical protein